MIIREKTKQQSRNNPFRVALLPPKEDSPLSNAKRYPLSSPRYDIGNSKMGIKVHLLFFPRSFAPLSNRPTSIRIEECTWRDANTVWSTQRGKKCVYVCGGGILRVYKTMTPRLFANRIRQLG